MNKLYQTLKSRVERELEEIDAEMDAAPLDDGLRQEMEAAGVDFARGRERIRAALKQHRSEAAAKPFEKFMENGRVWLRMGIETLKQIAAEFDELDSPMPAAYRQGPEGPLAFRERTLDHSLEGPSASEPQDQGSILNSEPLQGFDWVPRYYEPDPEDGDTIITLYCRRDLTDAPEPEVRITLDGDAIAPDDREYMPESRLLRLEFNRLLPERVEFSIGAVSAEHPSIEIALTTTEAP